MSEYNIVRNILTLCRAVHEVIYTLEKGQRIFLALDRIEKLLCTRSKTCRPSPLGD